MSSKRSKKQKTKDSNTISYAETFEQKSHPDEFKIINNIPQEVVMESNSPVENYTEELESKTSAKEYQSQPKTQPITRASIQSSYRIRNRNIDVNPLEELESKTSAKEYQSQPKKSQPKKSQPKTQPVTRGSMHARYRNISNSMISIYRKDNNFTILENIEAIGSDSSKSQEAEEAEEAEQKEEKEEGEQKEEKEEGEQKEEKEDILDPLSSLGIHQIKNHTIPTHNVSEYIDIMVWVSHAASISTKNNFYPMFHNYHSIGFYGKFPHMTSPALFESWIENECKILTDCNECINLNYRSSPISDKKKAAMLPPLIFCFNENDKNNNLFGEKINQEGVGVNTGFTNISQYMGLWFARLKLTQYEAVPTTSNKEIKCECYNSSQLINYEELSAIYAPNSKYKFFTYASIFSEIKKGIKKLNTQGLIINPSTLKLKMLCCMSIKPQSLSSYPFLYITNLESSITYTDFGDEKTIPFFLENAPIFNKENYPHLKRDQVIICPLVIKVHDLRKKCTEGWQPLVDVITIGCGLNILSFYDIIDKEYAESQLTCLPGQGTSIFKIIDYINSSSKLILLSSQSIQNGYLIIRKRLEEGIEIILNYINDLILNKYIDFDFCVVFKMYENEKIQGLERDSHKGHTVSIAKVENGPFLFIDPQINIAGRFQTANQLIDEYLKSQYNSLFNYIDIIFALSNTSLLNKENFGINRFEGVCNIDSIIERHSDINYGGKSSKKQYNTKQKTIYINSKDKTKQKTSNTKQKTSNTKQKTSNTKQKTSKTKDKTTKTKNKTAIKKESNREKIFGDNYELITKNLDKIHKKKSVIHFGYGI